MASQAGCACEVDAVSIDSMGSINQEWLESGVRYVVLSFIVRSGLAGFVFGRSQSTFITL
jgi:hypothetical protein